MKMRFRGTIRGLAYATLLSVVTFFLFSFAEWNLSPVEWPETSRDALAVCMGVYYIISIFVGALFDGDY